MEFNPWARAEYSVREGFHDILIDVWKTKARSDVFHFSEAYAVNELKFIKRADDPFEYSGIDSLSGKKVATIRGYGYSDPFLNATTFSREETADFIQNINKLLVGHVDLTLEDEIVAKARLLKENLALLGKVAFSKISLSSNPLYIASGLRNPRHEEIISAFNRGLATIKADKTYSLIMASHGME